MGRNQYTFRITKSPEERFWSHVYMPPCQDDCWLWTGHRAGGGYGAFYLTSHPAVRAHRFAYELLIGPIPKGLQLDHLCRNRGCVNPSHLEPVTQRENILRGEGIAAQNSRKTHCIRGHVLADADPQGKRRCRQCKRDRTKRG